NDAEDRGIHGDGQRECQACHDRKPRSATERSRRNAQIPPEIQEPHQPKLVACLLLGRLDAAKAHICRAARLVWRHAGTDVLRGLFSDMKSDLVGQARLARGAVTKSPPPFANDLHGSEAFSTRLIARDSRFQEVISRASAFRPAAV